MNENPPKFGQAGQSQPHGQRTFGQAGQTATPSRIVPPRQTGQFGQAGVVGGGTNPQQPAASSAGGVPITIEYEDSPGLLWLSIKNFLLSVITLTIYRFWAKTNVRRHVWSNIKINGEALEYTGTGKELFIGFLIIFCILGLPAIGALTGAQLYWGPESVQAISIQAVITLGFLMLYGMAIYRARRYRISRTLWRGIRGSLDGSSFSFSMLYFGAMLLRSITMGWSTPAMNLNIQNRLLGDMNFGNRSFLFGGPAGPLYARFAACWFLTPVAIAAVVFLLGSVFGGAGLFSGGLDETLKDIDKDDPNAIITALAVIFGIIFAVYVTFSILWTFYTVREMNLFAGYTKFDNATFEFDATVPSLVGLWLGNLCIMIFTLGIGQPFVVQRLIRYMCDRLTVNGTVNVAAIQQSFGHYDTRGEGLVDVFDVDAF